MFRSSLVSLLLVALPQGGALHPPPQPVLRIDRGEGRPALFLPRDEKLVYGAHVSFGPASARVGSVVLRTGVEPYRASLLMVGDGDGEGGLETGWVRARARGEYLLFKMDTELTARHLPTEWPRILFRNDRHGDRPKRREQRIGLRHGVPTCEYRSDTDKNAPPGTRIWKKPRSRVVAPYSVDMLSAVYMARTLIRNGLDEMSIPLVDNKKFWLLKLRRGAEDVKTTPAGTFEVVEVKLSPRPHPDDPDPNPDQEFEGLFGLKGDIHLWVDREHGIPVLIRGDLPVGIVDLRVEISLEEYRGVPAGFGGSKRGGGRR